MEKSISPLHHNKTEKSISLFNHNKIEKSISPFHHSKTEKSISPFHHRKMETSTSTFCHNKTEKGTYQMTQTQTHHFQAHHQRKIITIKRKIVVKMGKMTRRTHQRATILICQTTLITDVNDVNYAHS